MTVRVAQILLTIVALTISGVAMLVAQEVSWNNSKWASYNKDVLLGAVVGFGIQSLTIPFIWLPTIRWNALRIFATILTPPVAAIIAGVVNLILYINLSPNYMEDIAFWSGTVLALTLQPVLFILIWTDWSRAGFRPAQSLTPRHTVACPNCNYDLSASNESRCPECGTQHTLGELFTKLTATDPIEQPPSPNKPKA